MTLLEDIGERDGWRCWLCDEPVDPQMSVNDSRGPSLDSRNSSAKASKGAASKGAASKSAASKTKGGRGIDVEDAPERLAHRGCNTKKGAIAAVIPWPARLFVSEPAPLIGVAERLERKGGREVVARCLTKADAQETADWLTDRFSRLAPELGAAATIDSGGGQFLVALTVDRRR
jgi:hypothetical protein